MVNYVLSPLVTIQRVNSSYILQNMLHTEFLHIHDLHDLFPSTTNIDKRIFIEYNEINKEKQLLFDALEKRYYNSKTTLGYIETTAICPYLCKMCPKSSNKIYRDILTMPIDKYENIISQLDMCSQLTLHLFGDPLCDNEVYKKIQIANKHGIMPSFSTNLISLMKLNFDEIMKLKLRTITISIDSLDAKILSELRGNINQNLINKCIIILQHLIETNEKIRMINKIILQVIDLKISKDSVNRIKEIAKDRSNVIYYEKPFINFPLTNQDSMGNDIYVKGEKTLIYSILNKPVPFRCLKPWNKQEMGVLSDGSIVPCCMSFNSTYNLGNIFNNDLITLQESKEYKKFRENIFNSADTGVICNHCNQKSVYYNLGNIDSMLLEQVADFCINQW